MLELAFGRALAVEGGVRVAVRRASFRSAGGVRLVGIVCGPVKRCWWGARTEGGCGWC